MREIWCAIQGYETLYEVSNLGRVKRIGGVVVRSDGVKTNVPTSILTNTIGKNGYPFVSLHINGFAKKYLIHRLVAQAFLPNPSNKLYVNHIDGNKCNNRVDNLEWVTPSENLHHAYSTKLRTPTRGERNRQCKLTTKDIEWIKTHVIKGDKEFGCKALAKKFGVTEPHISCIVNGKKRRYE